MTAKIKPHGDQFSTNAKAARIRCKIGRSAPNARDVNPRNPFRIMSLSRDRKGTGRKKEREREELFRHAVLSLLLRAPERRARVLCAPCQRERDNTHTRTHTLMRVHKYGDGNPVYA